MTLFLADKLLKLLSQGLFDLIRTRIPNILSKKLRPEKKMTKIYKLI